MLARRPARRPPPPHPRHLAWAACRASSGAKPTPLRRRPHASRLPRRRPRRPQPHDALHGHRSHQARPRLEQRRLHHRALAGLRTANEMLLIMGSAPLVSRRPTPPAKPPRSTSTTTSPAPCAAHRRQQPHLLRQRLAATTTPARHLARITVPVMWINSADDFINPPELGIAAEAGQTNAPRKVHPPPHHRRNPRPRHPHRRRHLEGLPRRTPERIGTQTISCQESKS